MSRMKSQTFDVYIIFAYVYVRFGSKFFIRKKNYVVVNPGKFHDETWYFDGYGSCADTFVIILKIGNSIFFYF